jgi:hypothetical protein
MTVTDQRGGNGRALEPVIRPGRPDRLGQGTAVEQSRAVAEVEAAIVVAMRYPRHVAGAVEAMREACRHTHLAEKAFFRFPRGGQTVSGPSIHLARELARVWGNFQYGIAELRRDDDFGQSEMLAFAWDVQTNTRNSSTFIVPHLRDKRGGPERLTDVRDIYESNANAGARRVREAIFAVLPAWFTEEAKDLCAQTLSDGGGKPLAQRVADATAAFGRLGVTGAQLEEKIGRPAAEWIDQDVATLQVVYRSLMRGEITRDEEFPPARRVTADEILSKPGSEPAATQPRAGKVLTAKLDGLLRQIPLGEPEDVAALLAWQCGGPYTATRPQAALLAGFLEDHLQAVQGDSEEAASAIWAQYRAATAQDAAEDGQEPPG